MKPMIIHETFVHKPTKQKKKLSPESIAGMIAAEVAKVCQEHDELEGNKTVDEGDIQQLNQLVRDTGEELQR